MQRATSECSTFMMVLNATTRQTLLPADGSNVSVLKVAFVARGAHQLEGSVCEGRHQVPCLLFTHLQQR